MFYLAVKAMTYSAKDGSSIFAVVTFGDRGDVVNIGDLKKGKALEESTKNRKDIQRIGRKFRQR